MGLAVQTTLPAGTGSTTLEFKISFIPRHEQGYRRDPHRGQSAELRPSRGDGRSAASPISSGKLLAHATTTCLVFEFAKGT